MDGDTSNQLVFWVTDKNVTKNPHKFYFIAERPSESKAKCLILTDKGYLRVLGTDDKTVVWTTADIDEEARRESEINMGNLSYEFIMQDDGNAVLYKIMDMKGYDREYMRRYEELEEVARRRNDDQIQDTMKKLEKQRFRREKVWALWDRPSFPSLQWPGRTRLRTGEKLRCGEELSDFHKTCTLKVQSDGNLVLYQSGNKAIWASNTSENTNGKPEYYLAMQQDGNLVLCREYEAVVTTNMLWVKNESRVRRVQDMWASGSNASGGNEYSFLQIRPGKMVIVSNSQVIWDSSQQNWSPAANAKWINLT